MKNINKDYLKTLLLLLSSMTMISCGNIIYQIQEKNREDYILSTPGVYDPVLPSTPKYTTHKFRFLEKFSVSHDWPYAFDICKYSTMTLPKKQQGGTWYSSYNRLGDMFEYNGVTYQEASTVGYPEGTRTSRTKDRYVRTWKNIDGLGIERKYGYTPICRQSLLGSSQSISISLYATEPKWLRELIAKTPDDDSENFFFKKTLNGMEWLVRKRKYKEPEPNIYGFGVERWMLKIKGTGYYYSFSFLANKSSLKNSRTHTTMKKIFRHLIESVKIEPLSKEAAAQARDKVKKLIKEIEEYQARNPKQK